MATHPIIFFHGTVILPDSLIEDGVVICRDGRISHVGSKFTIPEPVASLIENAVARKSSIDDRIQEHADTRLIDAQGGFISPGFVDIHVHGGAGADFMDGAPDALICATRAHARHGTTSIFPTTTTGSPGQIEAMLRACESVRSASLTGHGARIAGVHFYGPYFAEEKTGCHSRSGRRNPDPAEYERALASGIIKVATCAAELPGAEGFYREAHRCGCLVTCGHSNASWTEMNKAFSAGMRHVDHFWCAMSSVPSIRARCGTPSQGSMEQFVLMHEEMSTEVIADGLHLAPELLEFAFRMKGVDRLCLVTDANRGLDMPPGRYRFGPNSDGEWFIHDGDVGRQADGGLASSVKGMDAMVRQMGAVTSAGIMGAVRMATLTPAERAGLASEIGSLTIGKRADLLVLTKELTVKRVFIGGDEFLDL